FGVIGHVTGNDRGDAALESIITASNKKNLGFVVASGIKSSTEPCTDELYTDRKNLLDSAQNAVLVSLAASDWVNCTDEYGKTTAIERLASLRNLFFNGDFSLGASRLPLIRQSSTPKFRAYSENTRWELGDILFATVNLPAGNNHYLNAAGRNSEFEDRQIATLHWLERIFMYANYKKLHGIVLFSDGNPLRSPSELHGRHDGFRDVRQKLKVLSKGFGGKVLIVYGQTGVRSDPTNPHIDWQSNLGLIAARNGWLQININESDRQLFSVANQRSSRSKK
ncbi:MAG: hypothetical protein ABI351_09470, partial [Herbaspirillum sp.]